MRPLLFLLLVLPLRAIEVFGILPTGSMEPLFNENYFLLVERRDFASINVGDIIVYRLNEPVTYEDGSYTQVVHRVWRKSSGGHVVLCKGDANEVPDSQLITEAHYVGTVVHWVTKDEYFSPAFRIPFETPRFSLDSAAQK